MDSLAWTGCTVCTMAHCTEKGGDTGHGQLVSTNQAGLAGWPHIVHTKMTNTKLKNKMSKSKVANILTPCKECVSKHKHLGMVGRPQ